MSLKRTPDRPSKLLDRKDTRFKKLHGTCDVVFYTLHQSEIGANKISAKVITDEDEEKLWKTGVLNTTTPIRLQRAVFYYVRKACCLRGGEEQRDLKPSQFCRLHDPERYICVHKKWLKKQKYPKWNIIARS